MVIVEIKNNDVMLRFVTREIQDIYKKYNAIEAEDTNLVSIIGSFNRKFQEKGAV